MKKLLFPAVLIIIFSTAINAQSAPTIKKDIAFDKKEKKEYKTDKKEERKDLRKIDRTSVSTEATQQFNIDFSNAAIIKSRRSANFDEFTFKGSDNNITTAYYDDEANLVGTTQMKRFKDIPEQARNTIKKDYKDYKISGVVFFDDNEANETNMVLYDTQFDDEDSYFVELQNATKKIVLHVSMNGEVVYFTSL